MGFDASVDRGVKGRLSSNKLDASLKVLNQDVVQVSEYQPRTNI